MSFHRAALAIAIALVCTVHGTTSDRHRSAQTQSGTAAITGTVVTFFRILSVWCLIWF